ncbi:MAG: GntR family transcriptional regulator [Pseudomonadota bacterium]
MNFRQSINRPTLHEELVERLRSLIVEDMLKPGEKVPEKELCETFSVSRTPLREALKVLASEGLVTLQANRGARVTDVTREEIKKTFVILARLEQLVGELASVNLSEVGRARIEERHADMVAAFKARGRTTYFQANQDIHNALLEGAGNDILDTHHRMLESRVRRARFMVNLSEERWAQAISEHEDMMVKLRNRDATGLGQVMKTHMENKLAAYMKVLEAEDRESEEP